MSEECLKELVDLVVLTPQWLMDAMKVIMELTVEDDIAELDNSQLQRLNTNGVADSEVFEACWKKFLPTPSGISVRHLCLIFQAYCLIYPVKCIPVCPAEFTRNQVQDYIIPCKLPDDIADEDVRKIIKDHSTFYFDFFNFLPNELYYRLMCLALSFCEAEEDIYNMYSKRRCLFVNLKDTKWVIELEQEKQRLKIIVV